MDQALGQMTGYRPSYLFVFFYGPQLRLDENAKKKKKKPYIQPF